MRNTNWSRTKIVATLGPASSSPEILKQMIDAGVNVFRLNSSHGSYEDHQKAIDNIRELNKNRHLNIAILIDLQGPKLRIGEIENGHVIINNGDELEITTSKLVGNSKKVYITYPEFPADVHKGERVLIDDGKLVLEVLDTNRLDTVKTIVVNGGVLSSKKGVNLPNTKVSLPCLTEKDLEDLQFALKNNVEWVGLSFVRKASDIIDLKERIKAAGKTSRVIAKIEKPEALTEIDEIIEYTDGLMVARGDLGVELPLEQVPLIQKMLVEKCVIASKPVIIATQMMESMITNYSPTRAEVNDVANAVLDGADAVMLSGETSVGKFPVKVIEDMKKIILTVEEKGNIYFRVHPPEIKDQSFVTDSICYNACLMAQQSEAKGIVCMTNSGYAALKVSSHRPKAHVFVFTDNTSLLNTMALVWGVRGFYYNKYESTDQTIEDIKLFLRDNKYLKTEDLVINVASMPMRERGRTNMLKLSYIG